MIYGYRSALAGMDTGHVLDYARAFEHALTQARKEVSDVTC